MTGYRISPRLPVLFSPLLVCPYLTLTRMLDHVPDDEHMLPTIKTWSDNPKTAWYYEAVQEATSEHIYVNAFFPPHGADMTREEALMMIIVSIAVEELALSHILNTEG